MRPAVIGACNFLQLTPVWVTPFFRVTEHVPKARELKKFLQPFGVQDHRVILQIMGKDPQRLADTASLAMELGAAGIDLNCGCPSNQVVRHGSGAGCMLNIDHTARIIAAVRRSIPESFFSVKTRLGFYDAAECEKFLPCWEAAGQPDLFTLHYRTAVEGYRRVPGREERLAAAGKLVSRALVFGNGDVENIQEARELMQTAGLAGVMIGRGFWHDPYILARAVDPLQSAEAPNAAAARQKLWQQLEALPFEKEVWSRGSAIEMASLIMGPDSPEAQKLKAQFRSSGH